MKIHEKRDVGGGDARDAQCEPHIIVRRQLLAVPHKTAQNLKAPRRAPHRRRNRIPIRQHAAAPPGRPLPPHAFLRKRKGRVRGRGRGREWGAVRKNAECADVARAGGTCGEHLERADALCGAAEDDARVERWGEGVCDS
jgi:hypothetical protein